jgi:hypothetical protein
MQVVARNELDYVGSELGKDVGNEVLAGMGKAVEEEIGAKDDFFLGPLDAAHLDGRPAVNFPEELRVLSAESVHDLHSVAFTKATRLPPRTSSSYHSSSIRGELYSVKSHSNSCFRK